MPARVSESRKRWSARPVLIHEKTSSAGLVISAKWDEDAIFFKSDLFCDLPLSMDFTMGSLIQRGRLGAPRAA